MIQLELQMLETEIQTARDYGLTSGEREDKLEQFKDAIEKGADRLGLTPVIEVGKEATRSLYQGVSQGTGTTGIGVQPGVRKNG
jgi:hypothetical protein